MKIGDLVRIAMPGDTAPGDYMYGLVTDLDPKIGLSIVPEEYKEVWVFKYPPAYGWMEAKKCVFRKDKIVKIIKTVEDLDN